MNLNESAMSLINKTWRENVDSFRELVNSGEDYHDHVVYHAINLELVLTGEITIPEEDDEIEFSTVDEFVEAYFTDDPEEEEEQEEADDTEASLDEVDKFISYVCDYK
jgi:hypothetical protein